MLSSQNGVIADEHTRLIPSDVRIAIRPSTEDIFATLPYDVVKLILRCLSLKDIASVAQVNTRMHAIAESFIPRRLVIDKESGLTSEVPFMIDANNKPHTYTYVRQHLAKLKKLDRELYYYNNNVLDKKIFQHNEARIFDAGTILVVAAFLIGVGLAVGGAASDDDNLMWAGVGITCGGMLGGISLGGIFKLRHEKINVRKKEIAAEVSDTLTVAKNGC